MAESESPARAPEAADLIEAAALRKIVTVYGRLSALATERTDLAAVSRLLAGAVGSGVAVLGPTLEVLAASGPDDDRDVVERLRSHAGRRGLGPVLAVVARNRRAVTLSGGPDPCSTAVVAPVTAGDDLTAYLITFTSGAEGFGEDVRLLLTEHAAMICGVVMGRERIVAAAAGRARRDLIEGVLHGRSRDDGEVRRWAGHLGFVEGRVHHVLAARAYSGPEPDRDRTMPSAHAVIEGFLVHSAPEAIVAAQDDEVVGIVPSPGTGQDDAEYLRRLAGRCRAAVEARHPGTVTAIGIGDPCTDPVRVRDSYGQARRSLETVRRTSPGGGVMLFAEIGIQRLLLRVPDVADLHEFAHEVLGAVVEQDATGGSDHVRTLAAYLRENSSPSRAATVLHVHPNTVSYRVRRIEELSGLSLERYRDRLLAQVAVEILEPSGGES